MIQSKIRSMLDCGPHTARDIYIEMMEAGIFDRVWYTLSWADQETIVKNFVRPTESENAS